MPAPAPLELADTPPPPPPPPTPVVAAPADRGAAASSPLPHPATNHAHPTAKARSRSMAKELSRRGQRRCTSSWLHHEPRKGAPPPAHTQPAQDQSPKPLSLSFSRAQIIKHRRRPGGDVGKAGPNVPNPTATLPTAFSKQLVVEGSSPKRPSEDERSRASLVHQLRHLHRALGPYHNRTASSHRAQRDGLTDLHALRMQLFSDASRQFA
jgi:hypothetical protein